MPDHRQRRRSVINDRGVGLRGSRDRGQVGDFNTRRQNDNTPSNAIEFNQRQRGA